MILSHATPFRAALLGVALALVSTSVSSIAVAGEAITPKVPAALFNGRDLSGWVVVGKDGDPAARDTWSVRDGILTATGAPFGYVRTEAAYRDYALRVEWRWVPGTAPIGPNGKPRGRNSGVLLHTQGEDKVWPISVEAQLMEGSAGDIYAISTSVTFKELTALREKLVAEAGADETAKKRALAARRIPRQQASSEKAIGEWNTYEIECRGDTVTLTVNGVLQNTATGLTITGGTIGLQSEGMPIEFRRVELLPLK